jgi:hypothetical protein
VIKSKHDIDWYQKVYLFTDPEQKPYLVVGIYQMPTGFTFTLSHNGDTIDVYDGEFSTDINEDVKLGIEKT